MSPADDAGVDRSTPGLRVERVGPALHVVFDRPQAHNAITFAMYEGVHAACDRADAEAVGRPGAPDGGIRAVVLRGAGGRAFVSGTDIGQFAGFDGAAGVAYEARVNRVLRRLEDLTVPTVAAVDGYCVGAGLGIAAVCDLRIATRASRFGVPIARTLGNCLSMEVHALLVAHLGRSRTVDMLLRARLLDCAEMAAAGFVTQPVDDRAALTAAVTATVAQLAEQAPMTMWATRQAMARLRRHDLPDDDDVLRAVYGSRDLAAGVAAFGRGERPTWTGT